MKSWLWTSFWAYSDNQIAVSARKMQHPRSTLKSISTGTPLTTIPESPEASGSSSLEPSWEPEGEVDGAEEADTVTELAAAAVNMAEKAQKERVEKDLAASLEKHQSTETDLGNYQIYKEALLESRDLSDARERAESAPAEVKEISLANETLEDKLKRLEQQVEDLQQKLAVVREEKAEMEKLVREKMAKETPEAGKVVAK